MQCPFGFSPSPTSSPDAATAAAGLCPSEGFRYPRGSPIQASTSRTAARGSARKSLKYCCSRAGLNSPPRMRDANSAASGGMSASTHSSLLPVSHLLRTLK